MKTILRERLDFLSAAVKNGACFLAGPGRRGMAVLVALIAGAPMSGLGQNRPAWLAKPSPLPLPSGLVVRVSSMEEILAAGEQLIAGSTLLIEPGVYDVLTLISRDGVHPSNPRAYQNDFSEEALANSGYGLRNYLTMMAYGNLIREVLDSSPKP